MKSKIKKYNEKYFNNIEDVPNAEELVEKKICDKKGNSVIFNVTGIIMFKGIVYIIFPCGYKIYKSNDDIQILFDLFTILINEEKMDKDEFENIDIEYEGNGEIISVAYEIIKDYREYGYVRIEQVVEGINIGGKVNWKKTMKLKTQIFNEDGMPIFANLVNTHKVNDKDALLRALHIYTINKSIAMFGELFGIKNDYDEEEIVLPVDKKYAIKFLRAERQVTYNTRLLRVIDLIIKFIDSREEESKDNAVMSLSTKSFYAVWELMCKKAFSDEYKDMKEEIPRPYWKIADKEPKYTEQIPDILYKENRSLFILDAKYYNVKKNKPGWHDLVKQYFYEMSLRAVMKDVDESYNVMLIPGQCEEVMKMWGIAEVEGVSRFGQVKGVELNMKIIVKSYCYGAKENHREILKKVINS